MSFKIGERIMLEVAQCISFQYKYVIIDAKRCSRPELIQALNRLIGQLTSVLEYHNTLENEKRVEDIETFKTETHRSYIQTPYYQPDFDITRKRKHEEILSDELTMKLQKLYSKVESKEHMIVE